MNKINPGRFKKRQFGGIHLSPGIHVAGAPFVPPPPPSGGPIVAFTDITSGTTTGGESNKGIYLSIFGWNFGLAANLGQPSGARVYIGGVEVDNYRVMFNPLIYARNFLQQIVVQVGSLGGAAVGSVNAIKVTVNGVDSNTDKTFMVQPGDIYFAAPTGNDATGVKNDITKPFRYVQQANGGTTFTGIWATLQPGDAIVIRGGVWADQVGFEGKWVRFQAQTGSAPTGVVGHGYIHITAYPAALGLGGIEDVHMTVPAAGAGGIHGCSNARATQGFGKYVSVSNLHIECSATTVSDGAPINLQAGADNWRVVGNNCGPWPSTLVSPNNAKAGGIVGEGRNSVILGNYAHDIDCDKNNPSTSALENHGIYVGAADPGCSQNVEIAWNVIENIPGGSGFQTFNSTAADTFIGIKFHHNFILTTAKYGINFADSTQSADCWNNIVCGTKSIGLRFNTNQANLAINAIHNTFYNCVTSSAGNQGTIGNSWNVTSGAITVAHNIVMLGVGRTNLSADFYANGGVDTNIGLSQNLYYDPSALKTAPAKDAAAITGNPLFTNLAGFDFTTLAGGAGVNACTFAEVLAIADDFLGKTRPVPGTGAPGAVKNDIGAMQVASS